jgi:putative ABC transport system substrate-binding protein
LGNSPRSHRLCLTRPSLPNDGRIQDVQATKLEMIINLKSAKALGLNTPLSLLGRADEVID